MSSDNGIYILKTIDGNGGFEYRVAHLQAVENYQWHVCKDHPTGFDKDCTICMSNDYCDHPDCWIHNARQMWKHCQVLTDEEAAWKEAQRIYGDMMSSHYLILEYGIQMIRIDKVFDENAKPISVTKEFSSPIESMEV